MASIWVAMSGGVDSSVAAARLVSDGHRVVGVTMQVLPDAVERVLCRSSDVVGAAKRVCDLIAIPHRTVDMRDVFEREVVNPFVEAYSTGHTPNPCVDCNTRVKFGKLLAYALEHDAQYFATGHYAKLATDAYGETWLSRASDTSKDQSYFLYRLTPEQLRSIVFPLGDLDKEEVRRTALRLGLPTAKRSDSQEVCFVPSDAGSFVIDRCAAAGIPGPIVDTQGRRLGTHRGIAHYTIGQRKGLGLSGGPWYVAEIRPRDMTLIVTAEEPRGVLRVVARDPVWRGGEREALAMVRYRAKPARARAVPVGDRLEVTFEEPVSGVAPGQSVVCYEKDIVLGGGVVSETE